MHQDSLRSHQIARKLHISKEDSYNHIMGLGETNKTLLKQISKLKYQNIELQFNNSKFEVIGSYSLKFLEIIEAEQPIIMEVIGELDRDQIVVTVAPSGIFIIRAEAKVLTELMSILKKENIRGGIGNNKQVGMGRVALEASEFLYLIQKGLTK